MRDEIDNKVDEIVAQILDDADELDGPVHVEAYVLVASVALAEGGSFIVKGCPDEQATWKTLGLLSDTTAIESSRSVNAWKRSQGEFDE